MRALMLTSPTPSVRLPSMFRSAMDNVVGAFIGVEDGNHLFVGQQLVVDQRSRVPNR